jgi:hypothetical protein
MTRQELIDDLKEKRMDFNSINFALNCYDIGWRQMKKEFDVLAHEHQRLLGELKAMKEKQHDNNKTGL